MENKIIWEKVLSELQLLVTKTVFGTMFSPTSLISLKDKVAVISCSNPVIQDLIETRYYSLIKNLLDKHTKEDNSLIFVLAPKKEKKKEETIGPLFEKDIEIKTTINQVHLRPDFTFENFAVSSSNEMAYAAATAVAHSPGSAYNPLFLYGGTGVGKTHLMQAIGHYLSGKKTSLKVIYCTGEEFTNEIIDAIQEKNTKFFKKKYRSADVLLIDDIQFIAGKTAVQEEFFHTFDTLYRERGQIVLTSDRSPLEINKLEDRLRSRFEGGLTIDIQPPDFELRTAILRIKAQQLGIDLPMDIAQLIAANTTDTRRLEGILRRIKTEIETKKLSLTPELVSQILGKNQIEEVKGKKKIEPREIIEKVSVYFNIKPTQLKSPKRDHCFAFPRQISMYLLKTELNLPLIEVGNLIGGRDHTTIIHGVRKITHLLSINENLRGDILGIKKSLYGEK